MSALFGRESLERLLSTAWSGIATIDSLDCSEYPCLATVTLPSGEFACCSQLMEAAPQDLADAEVSNYYSHLSVTEGGQVRAVVTLATEKHWSEDLDRRTKWRVEVAGELLDDGGDE